jgi:hypothetical protein
MSSTKISKSIKVDIVNQFINIMKFGGKDDPVSNSDFLDRLSVILDQNIMKHSKMLVLKDGEYTTITEISENIFEIVVIIDKAEFDRMFVVHHANGKIYKIGVHRDNKFTMLE